MTPHYHINLFWHEPDGCWVADVPDLGSCSGLGDTPEEALAEVQVALSGWLAIAREHNLPIPDPSYTPDKLAA